MHEKRVHDRSAFITLTYDDRNLPPHGSLVKSDAQSFLKRLRWHRPGIAIRFFGCGEYGETTRRPHYHILLFNTDFPDMKTYGQDSQAGFPQYTSKELEKLWPVGRHTISAVTFRSAAYVAGYVLKKSLEPGLDYGTDREPEFVHRSLKPGLGYNWFLKYQQEAYKHDSVIMEARETGIPRYYDTKYELVDKSHLGKLKRLRRLRAKLNPEDNTSRRRRTREVFAECKLKRFARNAE